MIDPDDPDVRMATEGRVFEDFCNGPIGSYLLERAKQQEEDAIQHLKTVNPEDPEAVRKFQNQALVADSVVSWLADVIARGQLALEKLKEENGD